MKKQNYSYIGISFIILLFGIIFIPKILNRINNDGVVDKDRHNLERNDTQNDTLAFIGNKKVPAFQFANQNGDSISNEDYKGKVYVVEFFFSTCQDICPVMNQNMQKVAKAYPGENVGIASISIDPAYDTPEVLKDYAQAYGITHPNWNFLTGDKEEIFQLSNEGFNLYAAEGMDEEDQFQHSGYFALIDQEGNIRSRIDENGNPIIYYDGLTEEGVQMLIEDIEKLL
ncbi:MAG TPA: SCO family protein [Flavobacteriaceae bacterium]|nr:SCO family protein [Flavobacteriaceae bacterium]HBR53266.1 SCO family protein [Flavobacteriaceae bacterium]|tara:strand:- start:102 stop:785 length:684 start_codon:yes stop_codon:yes gene_type:complete